MKKITKYSWLVPLAAMAVLVVSCTNEMEEGQEPAPKGSRAYAEVTLCNTATAETRAMRNTYDGWSVSRFNDTQKDVAGMYAVRGQQNADDMTRFEQPVANIPMYYEGLVAADNNSYRFGNSAYTLDATTVYNYQSIMYYPYYEDMPDPWASDPKRGLWLRQEDSGLEKCIDFMCTSDSYRIAEENGVMTPKFRHYFVNLVVQRGEGFQKATCRDIWIVMQNPCTDIRIKRSRDFSTTSTSTSYNFTYYLQYTPGGKDGTESEEDAMIDLMDEVRAVDSNAAALPEQEKEHYKVNKYAVWKTWEASSYGGKESRYAIIPPGYGNYLNSVYTSSSDAASFGKVAFILIQDDNGKWQRVSDFYLYSSSSRYGSSGNRYVLTITLEGVKVVVRPTLEAWEDEVEVTDVHKVGIDNYTTYRDWANRYNLYIKENRSPDHHDELLKYGDSKEIGDKVSWTFYINHDITFASNEKVVIDQLDDVLEGTSTYTTYKMSNIQGPLINKIGENGVLRALEFSDVYLVQSKSDVNPSGEPNEFASQSYGALTRELAGGKIEKCRVEGVLFSNNAAGMIAGTVSAGGTVENCNVSGNVFGSSTAEGYGGLFGTVVDGTTPPTMPGTQYEGLKFIEN